MSVVGGPSRCIFFLLSSSCLLCGVGVLSIAFLVHQQSDKSSGLVAANVIDYALIALLIFGPGLLAIAVVGLCGAFRDHGCLLTLFSVCFATVLIGETAIFGVVYLQRDTIGSTVLNRMKNTISAYNETGHASTAPSWDYMQSKLECCGISEPIEDWKPYVRRYNNLPETCCVIESLTNQQTDRPVSVNGSRCSEKTSNRHRNGCFDRMKTFICSYFMTVFWIFIGFALVQIFAVFLALTCRACSSTHPACEDDDENNSVLEYHQCNRLSRYY